MFVQCMYPLYCVLFSPLWLKSEPGWPAISVTTVSCWANSLVWVAVCYFPASQQGGRDGELGNYLPP